MKNPLSGQPFRKVFKLVVISFHCLRLLTCFIFSLSMVLGCKQTDGLKNDDQLVVIQNEVINSLATDNAVILPIYSSTAKLYVIKNNVITALNSNSHIIAMGEDVYVSDHTLDNAIITGNKICWSGTSLTDDDGALVMRNFVNNTAEYNLVVNCPYGITSKCSGLTYTSGGIAYNIFGPSFKVGAGVKGVNGMKFYNNSFYNNRDVNQGVIGSVYISSNFDEPTNNPSTNCEVYNNIFYTKYQIPNIYCDQVSLSGLKCDYNVYWCESGEPIFRIAGKTITLSEWQAKGFDTHSVVVNPKFLDFKSLVPASPLNYGLNTGSLWSAGLSTETVWGQVEPRLKYQGNSWQIGAYVVE